MCILFQEAAWRRRVLMNVCGECYDFITQLHILQEPHTSQSAGCGESITSETEITNFKIIFTPCTFIYDTQFFSYSTALTKRVKFYIVVRINLPLFSLILIEIFPSVQKHDI